MVFDSLEASKYQLLKEKKIIKTIKIGRIASK